MWSRCGCVSTSAESRRTPSPRNCRDTSASGGPWSTSTAPSGTWSRIESPWPTSRNVILRPVGGGSRASGSSCQASNAGTAAARLATASGRRHRGRRCRRSSATGVPSSTQTAVPDPTCGEREPADHPRAGGDVGRQPAVQPAERERSSGQHGLDQRADECDPEQRPDRERDERVGQQRVDGNAAELQPEDRRGRGAAGGRDGERLAEPVGERVALERTPEPGQQQEDRADRGERELEAGLEQARRRPREQHRSSEREEVPAVPRAGQQPGERGEAAGDAGADDRGLPADREHVAGDRRDRDHLGGEAWDAEQPRQPEDAERQEGDVLARDGEQVVEPGRLEVVAQLVGQPLVLAEHDPGQHSVALPLERRGDRARDMRPEAIRQTHRCRRGGRRSANRARAGRRGRRGGRASRARRSRPPGRAARTRLPRSSSTAPWGGERPSGNSSSTRSRSERSSKRRTSAGRRSAKVDLRTGPVTTAVTAAERPTSGRSTLRSKASSRTLPHHQPASRAPARTPAGEHAGRLPRRSRTRASTAAATAGARIAFASARPTHAPSTRSVGQPRAIRATPRPAAARCARGRSQGSRRDRRRSESRRARRGSPGSSGP